MKAALLTMLLFLPCAGMVAGQGVSPVVLTNVELVTVDEDSAAATWVTNLPSDTRIQWGMTEDLGEENVVDESVLYHMARISGLQQGTIYYYRVGSDDSWSDTASFKTITAPGGGFKTQFAIVTDSHYDADGRNTADGYMYADGPRLLESCVDEINENPDISFVVTLGDLTNGEEADYEGFVNVMDGLHIPWYPVLGNSDKGNPNWFEYFKNATGRITTYHDHHPGGYHLVMLDTAVEGEVQGSIDDEQISWLEARLDAYPGKPTILAMHHQADLTDIFGLDPASKKKLDDVIAARPNVFTLYGGHNHKNTLTSGGGKRIYVTVAATVSYPVGYSIVRLYGDGYTQSFHKIEEELATSEESRIRLNTAAGDNSEDEDYLGSLGERSFSMNIPKNEAPTISSLKVDPGSVDPGGKTTVKVSATDPDGDELIYYYDADAGYIDGSGPTVFWFAPYEPGTYYITATVSDGAFTSEPMSGQLTVKEPPPDENEPPIIRSVHVSETTLRTGSETDVIVDAFDPDGDDISYIYEASGGSVIGSGDQVTYRASQVPGTYTLKVKVTDGEDFSEEERVEFTVWELEVNNAPSISRVWTSSTTARPGEKITIQVTASDQDGDTLTYHYDASDGSISGMGSKVEWFAPDYSGVFTIRVWVDDGEEDSNKKTVSISVTESPKDEEEDSGIPGFEASVLILALIIIAGMAVRRGGARKE
jgi:hypothetical protein